MISLPVLRSRFPVGSSASSSFGSQSKPGRSRPAAFRRPTTPAACASSGGRARPGPAVPWPAPTVTAVGSPVAPDAFANHHRQQDIFQRRQFGQQVIELKNHAELRDFAVLRDARAGKLIDPLAGELDLAGIGRVEGAQQVQQRALSRAALAHDRREFGPARFQIDPAQHGDLDLSLAIALFNAVVSRVMVAESTTRRAGAAR